MRSIVFITSILFILSFLGSCTLSNLNKSEEKIPTSTSIPKIELNYDKKSSSILEIGFDTEFVTNSSCVDLLKNEIEYVHDF